MGLKSVFTKGVNTIFKVLKDAVKEAQYVVVDDSGWEDAEETSHDIRIILDSFEQDDVEFSSFSDLIQPTDVKGLVPGEDLTAEMKTTNHIVIGNRTYTVVAFDTDAMNALYTILLRDT